MSATPVFTVATLSLPSKKVTAEIFFVSLASTTSRSVFLAAQAPVEGAIHVIAGPFTTFSLVVLMVVFGSGFGPIVFTFFASWLSATSISTVVEPAVSEDAPEGRG